MTPVEIRDLIAEAREIGSDYKGWDCDGSASICDRRVALIDRLAALTTPQEDEWEYGTALVADPDGATAHADHLAAGKAVAGWNESVQRMDRMGARNSGPAMIVRRRKAGPWLPVGGDDE